MIKDLNNAYQMLFYLSKLFILTVAVSMASFPVSTARKRLILITDETNSTFSAITQEDPEEYRIREYNETTRWINVTKESKKLLQRRTREEL